MSKWLATWPIAVYARTQDLGAPITPEFSGGYGKHGFVKGIVYAPIAQPGRDQAYDTVTPNGLPYTICCIAGRLP